MVVESPIQQRNWIEEMKQAISKEEGTPSSGKIAADTRLLSHLTILFMILAP